MEVTACQDLHETPRAPPLGLPTPHRAAHQVVLGRHALLVVLQPRRGHIDVEVRVAEGDVVGAVDQEEDATDVAEADVVGAAGDGGVDEADFGLAFGVEAVPAGVACGVASTDGSGVL